jgi:hypothetical protein
LHAEGKQKGKQLSDEGGRGEMIVEKLSLQSQV